MLHFFRLGEYNSPLILKLQSIVLVHLDTSTSTHPNDDNAVQVKSGQLSSAHCEATGSLFAVD